MTDNITGKVIVITGASSGMGEATARDLAAQGAKVVLGARRADRLDAIVRDITEAGGRRPPSPPMSQSSRTSGSWSTPPRRPTAAWT